jgi:CBS domain-containing protein
MTIRAILKAKGHDIVSISADATMAEAIALLASKKIGALPVIQDAAVVGIFSERDVVYSLASKGAAVLSEPISSVMTTPAVIVDADCQVLSALSLMTRRRIRHLPVFEGSEFIGFVSIGDLVKNRMQGIEAEAAAMRDYIAS